MKKKRSGGLRALLVIVILAGGAIGYGAGPGGWFRSSVDAAIEGTPVRRGPLRISETVRGNLEAKDSIRLKSELENRSTILYLIDEGTLVQEGDLVAELDVSEARDDRVVQEISLQNAIADFTKAREQYGIQVIQNESDIANAVRESEFAETDLEKYLKGDWPQELKVAEESIVLKEEELARAEDKLTWTKTLAERGFVQRTELEADEFAVERAKIEHQRAVREKELLEEYGNPRKVAELVANVEDMKREVRKVEKQAKARLADYEAARSTAEARLSLEREKLAKIERQIDHGKIHAPAPGMVVYARERERWGSGDPISEGTEVRERQEIVTIPRSGGMIVEASLHETILKKVQVGQPCTVVIDALPGQVFAGRVQFVAVLPDSQSYFSNPNQRVYRSEIVVVDPVTEMRPGMSCNVEILSAEFEDVHYVPVQSVFLDAGKPICFVRGPEGVRAQEVKVGLDNSKWVIVEEGLTENQIVLLSPPAGFTPRAAERTGAPAGSFDGMPAGEDASPGGRPVAGAEGRTGGVPAGMEGMDAAAMREAFKKRAEERGGSDGLPGGGERPSRGEGGRSEGGRSEGGRPEGGRPGGGRPGGGPPAAPAEQPGESPR